MNYKISFHKNYRGQTTDVWYNKFKTLTFGLLVFFIFFILGVYLSFIDYNRVITRSSKFWGYICFIISIISLFLSPFLALFKQVNKGFIEMISFTFMKEEDSDEWKCLVEGPKRKEYFKEEYNINMITKNKRYFVISMIGGDTYYIPSRILNEHETDFLKNTLQEIKEKRTIKTNNK